MNQIFIALFIIFSPVFSYATQDGKSTSDHPKLASNQVMIDGYVATCSSTCGKEDPGLLKHCSWVDKFGKSHFSDGYCPNEEKLYRESTRTIV